MANRPTYIASDAHLGAAPRGMERDFQRWLETAATDAALIFLNGDLFDFWFEWGSVIPRGHTRTLSLLRTIVDAGVPVHLMGGNHDWWGGSFLTEEIGVVFHPAPVRMKMAGLDVLLAHGDGLGQGDLRYRALRWILRGTAVPTLFRWIHPDLGTALARRVSRTDSKRSDPAADARSSALELWARQALGEDPSLDLVVLGHTHQPRRVEVTPGRFYLNAGDWLRHRSYLVLREGQPPELREDPAMAG